MRRVDRKFDVGASATSLKAVPCKVSSLQFGLVAFAVALIPLLVLLASLPVSLLACFFMLVVVASGVTRRYVLVGVEVLDIKAVLLAVKLFHFLFNFSVPLT